MKKTAVLVAFLFGTLFIHAQADSIQPPYKRYPIYPPVKLLLPDSSTYYNKEDLPKKSPVMLMLFSPTCEHCKHETKSMVDQIDKFKGITIVMATSMPFDSMMAFREKFGLARYKNIIVGHDTHYFLFSFFQNRNLPFMAFYNRKKELISAFEGGLPMEKAVLEFDK